MIISYSVFVATIIRGGVVWREVFQGGYSECTTYIEREYENRPKIMTMISPNFI